jgi:hypothetical protein
MDSFSLDHREVDLEKSVNVRFQLVYLGQTHVPLVGLCLIKSGKLWNYARQTESITPRQGLPGSR